MLIVLIFAKHYLYSANACGGGGVRGRNKERNAWLIVILRDIDFQESSQFPS